MIKITIPIELRNKWNNEKYLLEELENGKNGFLFKGNTEKINKAVKTNDVLFILERINALTSYSKYGYIENKGFFKEYKEWLDFALKEILKVKGIIVKSDEELYFTLEKVNKFLNDFPNYNILNLSIEKVATNCIQNANKNFKFNSYIKQMCFLFLDIGVGFIRPTEIADISYENYINHKEKEKTMKFRK